MRDQREACRSILCTVGASSRTCLSDEHHFPKPLLRSYHTPCTHGTDARICLWQERRFREAFSALGEAVKFKRESWQTWANYAHAALQTGHPLQASTQACCCPSGVSGMESRLGKGVLALCPYPQYLNVVHAAHLWLSVSMVHSSEVSLLYASL